MKRHRGWFGKKTRKIQKGFLSDGDEGSPRPRKGSQNLFRICTTDNAGEDSCITENNRGPIPGARIERKVQDSVAVTKFLRK